MLAGPCMWGSCAFFPQELATRGDGVLGAGVYILGAVFRSGRYKNARWLCLCSRFRQQPCQVREMGWGERDEGSYAVRLVRHPPLRGALDRPLT
jgi:hypothetical protein